MLLKEMNGAACRVGDANSGSVPQESYSYQTGFEADYDQHAELYYGQQIQTTAENPRGEDINTIEGSIEGTSTPISEIRMLSSRDRLVCHECGREFSHPSAYSRHKSEKHIGRKYTCNSCSQTFTRSTSLQRHNERVHQK